jgi:hypothetical protein
MKIDKLVKVAKIIDNLKVDFEEIFKRYKLDEEEKVIAIGLIANEYMGEDEIDAITKK